MENNVVCIQGLGFVGLAMATVVANAINEYNEPRYRVYGIDLPAKQKVIDKINNGELPFETEDNSFTLELKRAVFEYRNLIATTSEDYYSKAAMVIVDVHLTISKLDADDYSKYTLHSEPFKKAIHSLGKKINRDCLVLIETTVPPGFVRNVVFPILKDEFSRRGINTDPIVAHSYERVMPGKDYINSIRKFFRTYSGLTEGAADRAKEFLTSIIDTRNYPLRRELVPEASELAKVLENSYRAMNIAFIYEWTLFAEKMGINLFSVIEGIKNRTTHKNIMFPGLGVGGYCLTKDALLALWSNDSYYKSSFGFPFSTEALRINDRMPLHVVDLINEFSSIKGKSIIIMGVSYREDIGDTRFSPSEVLYKELISQGGNVMFHDPYIHCWSEIPTALFSDEIGDFDSVVFATRHKMYLSFSNDELFEITKNASLVVDANNILSDEKISFLQSRKIKVVGVGKGHINKKYYNE